MATHAIASDAGVVEACRRPQTGVMAGFTIIAGLNMARRFACNKTIIVAAAAAAHDRVVIDARHRMPAHRAAVTGCAIGG